jgi:hypothetical protein
MKTLNVGILVFDEVEVLVVPGGWGTGKLLDDASMSGFLMRSSIAAMAACPISRHG